MNPTITCLGYAVFAHLVYGVVSLYRETSDNSVYVILLYSDHNYVKHTPHPLPTSVKLIPHSHRFNLELDPQSLFGLHVQGCILIG